LIAAIVANIKFDSKSVNWLIRMSFVVLLGAIAISFIQKYRSYLISGVIERFYFVAYERLTEQGVANRVVGTFGNPNTWACGMLSITTVAASVVFFSEKIKHRIVGFLIVILVMYCVMVLIASRTGVFICMFILLLSFLLKLYCSRSGLSALLFAFLGILLFFFLLFLYSRIQVASRVGQMLSGEVSIVGEMSKRYYFWGNMLEGIKSSPVWGIGVVKFKGVGSTADNGFLRVAYLSGLIGLAAYLWFYFKFYTKLFFSLKSAGEFRVLIVSSFLFLFVLLGYDLTIEPFISVSLQGFIGVNVGVACATLNAISKLNDQYYFEDTEGLNPEVLYYE